MEEIEQNALQETQSRSQQGAVDAIPDVTERQSRNVLRTILIVVGILLVVAAISAIFVGLATHPNFTAVLRDISIIVLALTTAITTIFLIILLFQLQSLIVLLRDEVQPILESLNDTAGTVRGTTRFVSDSVVSPVIEVAGYAAAVRATLSAILGGSRRKQGRRTNTDKG
jgi:hypothetical protein